MWAFEVRGRNDQLLTLFTVTVCTVVRARVEVNSSVDLALLPLGA